MMKMTVKRRESESNGMQGMMMTKTINKWMKVIKVKQEGFWPNMREITKMIK